MKRYFETVDVNEGFPHDKEVVAINKYGLMLCGYIFKSDKMVWCSDENTQLNFVTHWLREITIEELKKEIQTK